MWYTPSNFIYWLLLQLNTQVVAMVKGS